MAGERQGTPATVGGLAQVELRVLEQLSDSREIPFLNGFEDVTHIWKRDQEKGKAIKRKEKEEGERKVLKKEIVEKERKENENKKS